MIYTDGIHIISDTSVDELHQFADAHGIKRCWFENKRGKCRPHYDITTKEKRDRVMRSLEPEYIVSSKEIVRILINTYEPKKNEDATCFDCRYFELNGHGDFLCTFTVTIVPPFEEMETLFLQQYVIESADLATQCKVFAADRRSRKQVVEQLVSDLQTEVSKL